MEPMYLSEIEAATQDTPALKRVRAERGGLVPQIFSLFAFKPQATRHLMRFTQEVMRGPSPLSAGQRELIAAFTSGKNRCPF
jgi:alkylhydroperoxidase family enzyme